MTEVALRTAVFLAVFLAMLAWEHFAVARPVATPMWRRRLVNLALAAMGTVFVRLVMPASLASTAYLSGVYGIGLFRHVPGPAVASWITTVLVLDLAVYLQHRAFHRWPMFWRLHAVHHADAVFDVTTGFRFHPIEILVSLAWKSLVVALLGAPAGAAVLFELLLSITALLTHGNVRLPALAEKCARYVFVTPTLHRIHHSIVPKEREGNYGFSLSCWDRLFGTYRATAGKSDHDLEVGLAGVTPMRSRSLAAMLLLPLQMTVPRR